jgi:hypothetical protein
LTFAQGTGKDLTPWRAMTCHDVPWRAMTCHDVPWRVTCALSD